MRVNGCGLTDMEGAKLYCPVKGPERVNVTHSQWLQGPAYSLAFCDTMLRHCQLGISRGGAVGRDDAPSAMALD